MYSTYTTPAGCDHERLRPGNYYLDASATWDGCLGRGSVPELPICQLPECREGLGAWADSADRHDRERAAAYAAELGVKP